MARSKVYNDMIHTRHWRRMRLEVMGRTPLCQRCAEEGRTTLATEVHHRVPVESGSTPAEMERLMFSVGNLMAVCRSCHCQIHQELHSGSREQNRRRTSAAVEGFISRYLSPTDENADRGGGFFKRGDGSVNPESP